ncbi:MAG: choice-of-anchor U domain-containing protein, partial [Syntrophales bacterium]
PAIGTNGVYPIVVTAANGVLPDAAQNFTLTVTDAPAITSANSTTFTAGSAGTFTVTATGTPTPALAQTGALPGGVTFTDNGNGTATLAGTSAIGTNGAYLIVITAANGVLPDAAQNFTLTVTDAPAITSANSATFTVGSAGTFTVTATGSPTPALAKTGVLPGGVTFIDNGNGTATLAGTPAIGTNGAYPIVITAANGAPPNATQSFTLRVNENPNTDSDYDSVKDPEERGPDGNNPYYDGNRDGIPDWRQSNAASFFAYDQERGRHYLTLAIPSGAQIETLSVQRTFDAPPPAGVSFPYGFFSFTLAGVAKGGAATATIYLDATPPQTYYKYGKTPDNPVDHWYEFAYDGETGAEVNGNTVVLHFIDGKRGDHDLEANGRITDPGGPAEIAPHAGLYFPYLVSTRDEKTEIGIINTKSYASTSTISYYGANGDLIRTAAIALGPYGKAAISSAGIPLGSASAIVSGDGDLVGYTRYVNGAGKRCAWLAATSPQKTFAVPHTAVNAEWATALGLFNPNDAAVEVTLVSESGGSSNLTLNPKASTFIQLTEGESVLSIVSTGYIAAMEMFDSLLPGGDRAALLLRERSLRTLFVPSILYGPGEFTGIGLTSHYHGTVNITGHGLTGETEELSFGTEPLGAQSPRSRMAFNLSGMLGKQNPWATISGLADFSSPFGILPLHFQGLAIYGKDNTCGLGALNLNALRFREGFIGILATAAETTLMLLNPDTAEATLTATGYNAAGEALASHTMRLAAGSTWTGMASDLLNGVSGADMTHIRMVSGVDLHGLETISTADRVEMLPLLGVE